MVHVLVCIAICANKYQHASSLRHWLQYCFLGDGPQESAIERQEAQPKVAHVQMSLSGATEMTSWPCHLLVAM